MISGIITKELAIKWAALVLIAYAGFCLFLFIVQRRLIYLPSKSAVPLPAGFELWSSLDTKEVWGYKRVSGAKECLFFFHGNGGNASGWSHAVSDFPGDIFVLEYPGYGERAGSPTEVSIKAAAKQGFEAEQKRYSKIVVVGQSLGAAVTEAIFASWPDRIHRLVLITPLLSLAEMAHDQYFFVPTRWLLLDKMELYEPWRKFPGKTQIVIAGADELIPHSHSQKYVSEKSERVSVLELPAAGHNGVDLDAQFWKSLLEH